MNLSDLFGGGGAAADDGSSGFAGKHSRVATASTNATVVKASAGYVGSIFLGMTQQVSTTPWLKIYDKATAPTSADTPIFVMVNSYGSASGDTTQNFITFPKTGLFCQNGISYRITLNGAFNDDTAIVAGTIVSMLYTL